MTECKWFLSNYMKEFELYYSKDQIFHFDDIKLSIEWIKANEIGSLSNKYYKSITSWSAMKRISIFLILDSAYFRIIKCLRGRRMFDNSKEAQDLTDKIIEYLPISLFHLIGKE